MALQLSQIPWRIFSEETINSVELASVHRVDIAHSSKTRSVFKILTPSEVFLPCIWLLDGPNTLLQTTENGVYWQFPILPLQAFMLCREN